MMMMARIAIVECRFLFDMWHCVVVRYIIFMYNRKIADDVYCAVVYTRIVESVCIPCSMMICIYIS